MSNNRKHPCDCHSGNRTLVLLAQHFLEEYPEFKSFEAGGDWVYLPEFGVVKIEVGAGKRWSGIGDVIDFLRTVISDSQRLAKIRAAWIENDNPLINQLMHLIYDAEPITSFAPAESSELLPILQNRRIETWYQPVVAARSGAVWGYECLMRGRKANNDLVSAPQLLEWAQAERLTFMLDRVCRETHLRNAGRLRLGPDTRFLINFLPTAIYQPEFCLASSLAVMRENGLHAQQIIFEVVETEKIEDHARLKTILDYYRNSGFGVALDDIGSGYSGLSLLADLQPDLVKIDRELIAKSVTSKYHFDICASLVRLGKDNHQLVLAEGIETLEEKALMDTLEIDFYQGFLFGKPAPVLDSRASFNSQEFSQIHETSALALP